MDNADFTLTSTEETRAGAMACLEALRAIKNIKSNFHTDNSMEAWWRGEDNAVAIMLQAAGKPDGFTAGFVATFVEYFRLNFGGTPNLDVWKPEAAMTKEEKKASRAKFEEDVANGNKEIEITEEDKEQAYQEAAAQARKSIGGLYASADYFRGTYARRVTEITRVLVVPEDGYSFEEKTAEKIDQSITALGEIIRGGDVVFSRAQQMRIMDSIVAKAFEERRYYFSEAEMEECIQRFMLELLAATSDAEEAVPA